MLLPVALFVVWVLVAAVGKALGFPPSFWTGQRIFLLFALGVIYLVLRRPVRCPACGVAVHFFSGWLKPSWAPAWSERFFYDARYCAYCAVPFSSAAPENPRPDG